MRGTDWELRGNDMFVIAAPRYLCRFHENSGEDGHDVCGLTSVDDDEDSITITTTNSMFVSVGPHILILRVLIMS